MGEFVTLAVAQSVFAIEIGKIWPGGQLWYIFLVLVPPNKYWDITLK
jgi:hypothetical protein